MITHQVAEGAERFAQMVQENTPVMTFTSLARRSYYLGAQDVLVEMVKQAKDPEARKWAVQQLQVCMRALHAPRNSS